MRKVFIILSFILISGASLFPKFLKPGYYVPKMLVIPAYSAYFTPNDQYNPHKIFPIGWSRDGKFAYAVLRDWDDAIGNIIHFQFIIQDMIDNKALWKFQLSYDLEIPKDYQLYQMGSDGTKKYIGAETLFRMIWNKNQKIFIEKLTKYQINQDKQVMKQFPIAYNKDVIDCGMNLGSQTDASKGQPIDLAVTMVSLKNGLKNVWGAKGIQAYGGKVEGYFAGPLNETIALVISKYIPSYAGYPVEVVPVIQGVSIEQGFKK